MKGYLLNSKIPIKLVGICFLLMLSSCVRTDHLSLIDTTYPPTPKNQTIEMLTEQPSRKYVEIAVVEAKGKKNTTWNELRDGLREEARKIGADAIFKLQMGGEQRGGIFGSGGNMVGGISSRPVLRGVAIKYE